MIDIRLEEIKKVTQQDLAEKEVFKKIDDLARRYHQEFYIGEARELWQDLVKLLENSDLPSQNLTLYKNYQDIVTKLAWVVSPFLVDSDVEQLFKTKLLLGVKLEISFIEKVKGLMDLAFGDFNRQEQRRLLVLRAIKDNEEKIGDQLLEIEGEGEKLPPVVKNWLKDYDQFSQFEKRRERLSLLEYTNTNKNVRQLSDQQKVALRQILELYDYLRFFTESLTVEVTGHKIPSERITALETKTEVEKLETLETKPSTEKEVLVAYQGDPQQVKAITKEEQKLTKKFKDNVVKLREEFFRAVQNKNTSRTIAILRILAQNKELENFIASDEKLNKFLSAVWEKQFGKDFVSQFQKQPVQIKFVKQFLRYVLEERLGMSESDAARVGLQIGNIFVSSGKKGYNKMAYFDVGRKEFVWFDK